MGAVKGGGLQLTDSHITVEAKIHSGASQQGLRGRQLDTPTATAGITITIATINSGDPSKH